MEYDTSLDYYEILELEDDIQCSMDVLKASYRKLALKYHPDKTQHLPVHARQNAEEHFTMIQRAWEVLSDVEKRRIYDREVMKAQAKGLHAEEMSLFQDFCLNSTSNMWCKACRCGEMYQVSEVFL